jgi:hypothetical protein
MRRKLAVLLAGLAVAGAFVVPATARAAATTPQAGVSTAQAAAEPPGTFEGCFLIVQYYTQKWATADIDDNWLFFGDYADATPYCLYNEYDGDDEIVDYLTGNCLAQDTSDNNQIREEACSPEYLWEEWYVDWQPDLNGSLYMWGNAYTADCLYDNTQEPAIATVNTDGVCNENDEFYWFYFSPYATPS